MFKLTEEKVKSIARGVGYICALIIIGCAMLVLMALTAKLIMLIL